MARVKVELVLLPEHRNPAGVSRAVAAAAALGLSVTGKGVATLSAEIEADRFTELFGQMPHPVPGRRRGANDFGAPPGFALDDEGLRLPSELAGFVSTVSVAPPYTRLR